MILIIIGSILLLFGIFIFFRKNEGETEISLPGFKLKSNNSAVLLVCLGAVLITLGVPSSGSLQRHYDYDNDNDKNNIDNRDATVEPNTSLLPKLLEKSKTNKHPKFENSYSSCIELKDLIYALKTSIDEVQGEYLKSSQYGTKLFSSNYSISNLPAYMEISPDGDYFYIIFHIIKNSDETYIDIQTRCFVFIEECLLNYQLVETDLIVEGNPYSGRAYIIDNTMTIYVMLRKRTYVQSDQPQLIFMINVQEVSL